MEKHPVLVRNDGEYLETRGPVLVRAPTLATVRCLLRHGAANALPRCGPFTI